MRTKDKAIILDANQRRKNYKNTLAKIKKHKQEKAKHQLIIKEQKQGPSLNRSKYKRVLTKQLINDLEKADQKDGFKINVLKSKYYKDALELLNLNLVKTVNKPSNFMILKLTKLGKILMSRHDNELGMKAKSSKFAVLSFSSLFIFLMLTVISMFLPTAFLAIIFFILAVVLSLSFAHASDSIDDRLSEMHNSINNDKALNMLGKHLNSKEYHQEYKMFKHYATK